MTPVRIDRGEGIECIRLAHLRAQNLSNRPNLAELQI